MTSVGERARERLSENWEALCMSDDPFAGDFGGASDQALSDKMVTTRGGGTCHTCHGACEPKTRNRVRTEVYDGKMMRFRWCQPCCRAMAAAGIGRDSIIEARISLGRERRHLLEQRNAE